MDAERATPPTRDARLFVGTPVGLLSGALLYGPWDPSFSSRRPSDFYLFRVAARGWAERPEPV